jgi:hypothetical protein
VAEPNRGSYKPGILEFSPNTRTPLENKKLGAVAKYQLSYLILIFVIVKRLI